MKRLLLTLGLIVAFVLGAASPAAAHAQLITTSPSSDSVVNGAPDVVSVTFDEAVSVAPTGIRIFDATGDRVQTGDARHGSNSSSVIELPLPNDLKNGAYVVTWRATSSDSHPINGAFTFGVGTAEQADELLVESLVAGDESDPLVTVLLTSARAIAFAAMLLLVGAIGFIVLIDKSVAGFGRFAPTMRIAGVVGAVVTASAIVLQQAYVEALEVGDIFSGAVISDAVTTRYGSFGLARTALFVVLGFAITRLTTSRLRRYSLVAIGVGLLATVTLSGHSVSGRWVPLAIPTDIIHTAAAGVWIGGLVVLLVFVLRASPHTATVKRFSGVALASVVVLVVTGTIQSIRQVASVDALFDTNYGKILVLKVAIVALILLIAAGSRRWVNRRGDSSNIADLVKRVKLEAIGGVAVIIATAVLVNASPTAGAANGPETLSLDAGRVTFEVTVDPARQGPTVVHVYALSPRGLAVDVQSMQASISLPDKQIDDVPIELERLSTGHYSANANLPIKGDWELTVSAAVDDFTQLSATDELTVR